MAKQKKRATTALPVYPEKKWGPFAGGVSVAVWLQETSTDEGTRYFRAVTVRGRRFLDKETGEWRDGALRPTDIPSLVLALEAAQAYIANTPLPGQPAESEEPDAPENGEVVPAGSVPF